MIHFPSRTLGNATTVLLLLAATSALAAEGVLVSDIPQGLSTPAVLEKTQRVLVQRKWTVLRTDDTSVDARRKDKSNDCSLTVFVSDGALKYRGAAKVSQAWGAGKDAKMVTVDGDIPDDWIEDLESDIKLSLTVAVPQGRPASETRSNANTGTERGSTAGTAVKPRSDGSTRDKLKELEALRKDGLISEPEYQQMRKAVLDDF